MKNTNSQKRISFQNSLILLGAAVLLFSGVLYGQYKRGAYDKTLLFSVEYDKDSLPRSRSYKILRSVDKETHIVEFDMNSFTFYIDFDNTTEDTIDIVYSYDPSDRNSLKRSENPFKAGEFQKFKEGIIRSGLSKSSASYSYPGMDDFLSLAEKKKYAISRRDDGYVIQLMDPDTNRMRAMFGVDSTKNNMVIQNNYDLAAGGWVDSEIIYPVYAKNSLDPTVKKLATEATGKLGEWMKGRR